ncbi:MAG TPA: DUF3800 domain-containing protein [Bryobacteraceae bacterium]|nr:DUF3800 domain-containing protein [Bryobacteraceae bacterium]
MGDATTKPTPHPTRLVIAYFDETKKLQDAGKSVVFAGCAAHDEHWGEFNRRWGAVLAGTGITTVKLSAALAYRDDFYSWKARERERDQLLFRLASVIHESPLMKIACPILAGEFESLPDIQRKKLRDPQYCGFELCVRGTVDAHGPSDAFQIVCDLTENYAQGCLTLFNLLRLREPDLKHRLLGIGFADDKYIAGLQAADMIAYCARAEAEQERFGLEVAPVVRDMMEMFKDRGEQQSYFLYRAGSAGIGYAERD